MSLAAQLLRAAAERRAGGGVLLLGMVALILMRARRNPVDAKNVNDDWDAEAESVDSSMSPREKVAAGAAVGNSPGAANAVNDVVDDSSALKDN